MRLKHLLPALEAEKERLKKEWPGSWNRFIRTCQAREDGVECYAWSFYDVPERHDCRIKNIIKGDPIGAKARSKAIEAVLIKVFPLIEDPELPCFSNA